MFVHANLAFLRGWIAEKLADLNNRKIVNPERTFAYYWVKNAEDGENFQVEDIISECIHDFFAFGQWGTTIYNIMLKLSMSSGDPETRAWFKKTMESNFDEPDDGMPFAPLERFVMELLRVITPNSGSLSRIAEIGASRHERPAYLLSPHAVTNLDQIHWKDHEKFNPDRYNTVPTSDQIDEGACKQIGFVRCPFERTTFDVRDGRRVVLHNSGFGTVYGVVDGKPVPVCDHAGFAPFGFGYRRCPGEQFTIKVFEDFLRKVWTDKIQFLNIVNPVQVPVGPATVTDDNITFTKTT
jgi:cytochrome P450